MSDEIGESRKQIANFAASALQGEISYIIASRRIVELARAAKLSGDPDIEAFELVSSDTDHLPVEPRIRALWLPSALEKLQPEIDEAEAWARDAVKKGCRSLTRRFAR